jgi:hypothetical protein
VDDATMPCNGGFRQLAQQFERPDDCTGPAYKVEIGVGPSASRRSQHGDRLTDDEPCDLHRWAEPNVLLRASGPIRGGYVRPHDPHRSKRNQYSMPFALVIWQHTHENAFVMRIREDPFKGLQIAKLVEQLPRLGTSRGP